MEQKDFLSDEKKKKFFIIVGLSAILLFLIQLLFQFLFLIYFPFTSQNSFFYEIQYVRHFKNSEMFNGKIYYIKELGGKLFLNQEKYYPAKLLEIDDEKEREVLKLDVSSPYLINYGNYLWIISHNKIVKFKNGFSKEILIDNPIGNFIKPFVFKENFYTISINPNGLFLNRLIFDEEKARWQVQSKIDFGKFEYKENLKFRIFVKIISDKIHIFYRYGDSFYHKVGLKNLTDTETDWKYVISLKDTFYFNLFNKKNILSIIYIPKKWNKINIMEYINKEWKKTIEIPIKNFNISYVKAYDTKEDKLKICVLNSSNDTFKIFEFYNGKIMNEKTFSGEDTLEKKFMLSMAKSFLPVIIFPVIFSLFLTLIMGNYKYLYHHYNEKALPYASLFRRVIAQFLDLIIIFIPLVLILKKFNSFYSPISFAYSLLLIFFWLFLFLIVFSLSEGYWGITPGKFLLNIRTLGIDLKPCGFPRALLRNFLKIFDGLFHFLVGIILIAFTEKWQRIGDLVANTVVVLKEVK